MGRRHSHKEAQKYKSSGNHLCFLCLFVANSAFEAKQANDYFEKKKESSKVGTSSGAMSPISQD